MRAATVVQVLHCLFYVLLQLLVVAPIILSFKFYCSYDPSFMAPISGQCVMGLKFSLDLEIFCQPFSAF